VFLKKKVNESKRSRRSTREGSPYFIKVFQISRCSNLPKFPLHVYRLAVTVRVTHGSVAFPGASGIILWSRGNPILLYQDAFLTGLVYCTFN
jgi:hypothetical protein